MNIANTQSPLVTFESVIKRLNELSVQHSPSDITFQRELLILCQQSLCVDRVGLWLFDEDQTHLTCAIQLHNGVLKKGLKSEWLTAQDYPEYFKAIHSKKLIVASNVKLNRDVQELSQDYLSKYDITSALYYAITVNKQSIAMLSCETVDFQHHWQPGLVVAGETIASAIGQNLHFKRIVSYKPETDVSVQIKNEIERLCSVGGWQYSVKLSQFILGAPIYDVLGLSVSHDISFDNVLQYFTTDSQSRLIRAFDRAKMLHEAFTIELSLTNAKNEQKRIKFSGRPVVVGNVTTELYGAVQDITEQQAYVEERADMSKYLASILDSTHDAIITVGTNGKIQTINQATSKIFQYSENELVGQNISILMPDKFAKYHDRYIEEYCKTGNANIIGKGRQLKGKKKDGSEFYMELTLSEGHFYSGRYFIGLVRDVTARLESEKKLIEQAYTYRLTGLRNRFAFEQRLEKVISHSALANPPFYIFYVNVNKFSQINFVHGTAAGDDFIKAFSQNLCKTFDGRADVYQNKVDCFFIIFEAIEGGADVDTMFDVKGVVAQLNTPPRGINVEFSLSISGYSNTQETLETEDVILSLEAGAKLAKASTHTNFIEYNQQISVNYKYTTDIELGLQHAIDRDELELVLQPQFDQEGSIIASEALLRWHSVALGTISPADFIPIAERTGSILEIGRWVLHQACMILSSVTTYGEAPVIAVNVSARQMASNTFCNDVLQCLDKYNVSSSSLILELTETSLVCDIESIRDKMLYLSSIGIRFSIDDFGTGYSSLSYIQSLPLYELKIDKTFVDGIVAIDAKVPLVETILSMSKSLDLVVVAEGVENNMQQDFLFNLGCDLIQGYYLSKPLNKRQWSKLYSKLSHRGDKVISHEK